MTAKIKRYYTALRRYNRSKGFGIHSPFAFSFVLRVLRERLPYYAYADIEYRRQLAKSLAKSVVKHPRVISAKGAKMIFRITTYFNPRLILQLGTSYGVSTSAMLAVDSRSQLMLYAGAGHQADVYSKIVTTDEARIARHESLDSALAGYRAAIGDSRPYVLVNSIADDERRQVAEMLIEALNREATVIVRNISRSKTMEALWNDVATAMGHGMTFSNGKTAVAVGYKHLPRQDFSLWF